MKFSNLTKASEYEVRDFLKKELDLTEYQISILNTREVLRFSPFSFYKQKKESKPSLLWRLTIPLWPIYWLLMHVVVLLKWAVTGNMGFSQKFLDKFHYKWAKKINI